MKRIGTVVLALALSLGGVAAAAPAGADATHTMAVSPSTALSDGQVVTVTGTGYTEEVTTGGWAVLMCRGAFLSKAFEAGNVFQDCDVTSGSLLALVQPDASGVITTPYTARRTVVAQSGTVDCQTAPEGCAIMLGQLAPEGGVLGDVVPVTFGAPPAPRLTLKACAVKAWNDAKAGASPRKVLREFFRCVVKVLAAHHR